MTVFGQPPGDEVNADSWSVNDRSASRRYAIAEVSSASSTLDPGLRVEPIVIDGTRVLPQHRLRAAASATATCVVGVRPAPRRRPTRCRRADA